MPVVLSITKNWHDEQEHSFIQDIKGHQEYPSDNVDKIIELSQAENLDDLTDIYTQLLKARLSSTYTFHTLSYVLFN